MIIRTVETAALFALLLQANVASAQTPSQPAAPASAPSASPTTPTASGQVVRFRQVAARPGDRVDQKLGVELGLTTRITQSGQIAHESQSKMRREQHRVIEVMEVQDGRATKARATFHLSRRQSPDSPNPEEYAPQCIEGKTYLMSRSGDQLTITDPTGATPPPEELKLARESLENVGKPNPLAALLINRHVVVGQPILVPRDLVQELLGFQDPLGTVRRFELTLLRVDPASDEHPAPRGVFRTSIMVVPNEDSPLSIHLTGEIAVETETCRLAYVDLKGPVQLSSIERTAGGIYHYSAGGELNLSIQSGYDRTKLAVRPQ